MQVSEVMTRDVRMASPEQTLMDVAKIMADSDVGSLPVAERDHMIGMITDRDIVIRALAQGKEGATKVRDVMTDDIKYCFDDEDVNDVAKNMGDLQVRRLPVVDRQKRLVGILALGDIASTEDTQSTAEALCSICKPASQKSGSAQQPH